MRRSGGSRSGRQASCRFHARRSGIPAAACLPWSGVEWPEQVVSVVSLRRTGDGAFYIESLPGPPFDNDLMFDWRPETDWLSGAVEGRLVLWEAGFEGLVETGQRVEPVGMLNWSPNGQLLSVDRHNSAGSIYRVPSDFRRSPPEEVTEFPGDGYGVAWSPASDRFAYASSGASDAVIFVFALSSSSVQAEVPIATWVKSALGWSPGGRTLAVPGFADYLHCRPRSWPGYNRTQCPHERRQSRRLLAGRAADGVDRMGSDDSALGGGRLAAGRHHRADRATSVA